jgi:ubiquitin C-terminal hydrolase
VTVRRQITAASTMSSAPRHGLTNAGNTCYLNSAVQLLRHAPPFAALFGTEAWTRWRHENRKGLALADEMSTLIDALTKPGDSPVHSHKFAKAFITFAREINDEITFGAQADAAEAIQILLDGLHTHIAREVRMDIHGQMTTQSQREMRQSLESWAGFYRKEYSALVEHFYGQTQTTVICDGCGARSTRYEPWCVLKLPIPGAEKAGAPAPTLQECFRANFASEKLEDYACDGCKNRGSATMEHALSRYPEFMIVSLKRFTNLGAKVRARIPYDEELVDLTEWRSWSALQAAQNYRVVATVEHLGSSRGGHYCARGRGADGEWQMYDDMSVSSVGMRGAAGPDTYVLLLERRKA